MSHKLSAWLGGAAACALVLAVAPGARAADMDPYYVPKAGSPYDDPRYGDIYGHPPPPRYAEPRYVAPRYAEPRYYEPAPPPRVYRDRNGYLEPMPAPPRFEDRRYAERDQRCIPHGEIRRMLADKGWREMQDLELSGDQAIVSARRPNGHLYTLRIDRCSGEVVHARLLEGPADRPYAWRDRPGYRSY